MTKEDKVALNILKAWVEHDKQMEYTDRLENIEVYNRAIKALEQQSILDTRQRERQLEMEYQHGYDKGWKEGRKALEKQPCEDCISRKAVNEIWHTQYCDNREDNDEEQYKRIQALPSVKPSFKEWLSTFNTDSATQCFTAVQESKKRLEDDTDADKEDE